VITAIIDYDDHRSGLRNSGDYKGSPVQILLHLESLS
jgi:hypothetical protein